MFFNGKFRARGAAAGSPAAAALLLLVFAAPAGPARAQQPLSYPYLDGSEAAFPAFRKVAAAAAKGYVMVTLMARPDPITGKDGGPIETGSGIVLDRDGDILTVAHIARGPQFYVRVRLWDGRTLDGRVVKVSPKQELAVIRTAPIRDAVPIPFGDSRAVKKGDPALAIGSPHITWGVATVGTVRTPDIGERLDYGNWGFDHALELNLEVESGHSGGPVVDAKGRLIGMVAGYELGDTTKPVYRSPRITYAVPVNDIRAWLGR